MSRRDRATVPFDQIQPGDSIGTLTYALTPDLVDRHLRATGQAPYADASIAPVSMLAAEGVNLADLHYDISQSVHAGQWLEVVSLPRVGDVLTVSGRALDKFVKKGRRYVVAETRTEVKGGRDVARGRMTGVIVYAEGADEREDAPGPSAAASPSAAAAAADAPALDTLPPLGRTMSLESMVLYEPPGEQNIHTTDEIARAAGLPAAIATGTLFLAYVFDQLHSVYGPASLPGTELDVRIRLPVFAGDRIESGAEVTSREGGRVHHRVRCTGPHGDVIVGTACVRAK